MNSKRGKVGHLSGATQVFAMVNEVSCCNLRNAATPFALELASANT